MKFNCDYTLRVGSKNRPGRPKQAVKGVVLHWPGEGGYTAEQVAKYFYNNYDDRIASYNYTIGKDVYEIIPANEISISTNAGWWNANYIAVMFECEKDYISPIIYRNLQSVCLYFMSKYKFGTDAIKRHFDARDQRREDGTLYSKYCPPIFIDERKEGYRSAIFNDFLIELAKMNYAAGQLNED